MTFSLSPHNFGPDDGPPQSIRIARVLLWIQSGLLVVFGVLQVMALQAVRAMPDKQLAKTFGGAYKSQADVPYTMFWLYVATLLLLALALAFCASRVTDRKRSLRLFACVAEAVVIPVSFIYMMQLSCLLIIPAVVVIVVFSRGQGRDWFNES